MTDPARPTLGTIVGDRACASCGFNLIGQPIEREPHYALVVTRCPECGTVAALQEYPALGKWTRRWAAVLAALFSLGLVVLFGLCLLFATVQMGGTGQAGSATAATLLSNAHDRWLHALSPEELAAVGLRSPDDHYMSPWSPVLDQWPGRHHHGAVLAEHGGALAVIDWGVAWVWPFTAVFGVGVGLLWSLVLLHQPRWRAAMAPPAVFLLGALIAHLVFRSHAAIRPSPTDLAGLWPGQLVAGMTLGVMAAGALAGALWGRAIARTAVRMALPPRLRVPFTVLWTRDGLPPPRPR